MKKLFFTALFAAAALFPGAAFAANTYHFTCADLDSVNKTSGVSCTSGVLTVSGSSLMAPMVASPSYTMTAGSTYYVSFDVVTRTTSGTLKILSWDTTNGTTDQFYSNNPITGQAVHNTSFTATANASGGVAFHTLSAGWAGTIQNICITDTSGACEAVAPHTISASAGSNGSISPSGSVSVTDGSNQTFTFTPDTGYNIDTVTVDGSGVSSSTSYTFSGVTADHTIAVTFAAVTSGGGGGGGGGGMSGLGGLIGLAESGFASTTGFTMEAAVDYSGNNLIGLFIYSALSVLYNLRYWLAALLIFAGVVYFAYRAFKNSNQLV